MNARSVCLSPGWLSSLLGVNGPLTASTFLQPAYHEERHNLDQQIGLAELEHLEAREDKIDVEGALNFSEYVLSNAGRLWVESDLSGEQRLQQALFPRA